jgi:hypothetical protein
MRRMPVLLFGLFATLSLSLAADAETICMSQNFDDTAIFHDAYTFGSVGTASTEVGLWGSAGNGDKPVIVTDKYHSGTHSVKVARPTSTSYTGYRLYGATTNGGAPFTNGNHYYASTWMYLGDNSVALYYTEPLAQASATSPTHAAPGLAIYASGTYAGMLKAWAWNGSAWAWSSYSSSVVSANAWFDVKLDVDLAACTYDVLVDTGSGWSEAMSNVAMNPNITYSIDSMVFYSQSATRPSYVWVDDCKMAAVPEPSAIALLSCGIAGLLAYGRRKRK